MESTGNWHPIRLVITDDLRRSRLTVFFRLLLAIPHLLWLVLWSVIAWIIFVVNWFATLFKGQSPAGLHRFLAEFLRYGTQVLAYMLLVANPYPAFFTGSAGAYPIDVEIDRPAPQNRWKTFFRGLLALPAMLLAYGSGYGSIGLVGLAATTAFLIWFAALAIKRSPRGLRDAGAWGIGYGAQTMSYLLLLTDRYPYAGPERHLAGLEPPEVDERVPGLLNDDNDLRRSRLTVFFRLPLAVPHLVWIIGWTVLVFFAVIANWFSVLAIGRAPAPLARFLAAYIRYTAHLTAFLFVIANPFPGFTGRAGSYPLDVVLDPFGRQGRPKTLFRLFLAIPAAIVSSAAQWVLFIGGILGWFVALFTGQMPAGLQRAGAYSIGYTAQFNAYCLVLTEAYPHASPQAVFMRRAPVQLALPEPDAEALDS